METWHPIPERMERKRSAIPGVRRPGSLGFQRSQVAKSWGIRQRGCGRPNPASMRLSRQLSKVSATAMGSLAKEQAKKAVDEAVLRSSLNCAARCGGGGRHGLQAKPGLRIWTKPADRRLPVQVLGKCRAIGLHPAAGRT